MKIALYTPPFQEVKSYFDMVDIAEEYSLALETINLMELSEPDVAFARELRKYADEKNVKITCVSVGLNLVGDDSEEMTEKTKKYVDIAHVLGSAYLHHTIALEFCNPDEVIKNIGMFFDKGINAVEKICEYANKFNITVLHEDQGFIFNGIDGIKTMHDKLKFDTGIVADFGNILFVDEVIEDFIPAFSNKIQNVHVKDYKQFDNEPCLDQKLTLQSISHKKLIDCPLGEGTVNFEKGFNILKSIGYNGYIALECIPTENEKNDFENNLLYLRKLIK